MTVFQSSVCCMNCALSQTHCGCRGSLYGMLHSPTLELTWAQVAAMCLGAAKGMQHLHAHSVLHRDLKSGALGPSSTLTPLQLGLCTAPLDLLSASHKNL